MSSLESELDEKIRTLEAKLNDLRRANELHRENVSQRRLIISEYCDNLRSQVDLVTQSAIERLNQQNQEMLAEIAEYERELLDLVEFKDGERIVPENDHDSQILTKNDQFIKRIRSSLDEGNVLSQADLEDRMGLLEAMACELEEQVGSFHQRVFAKRFMHFVENEKFFSMPRNLGRLEKFSDGQVLKPKKSYLSDVKGITHLALMPNGNVLSGCQNGDVIVWSPDLTTIIHKSIHDLHLEEVTAIVALSEERFACAFNSIERCIRVYHGSDSNGYFPYTSLYEHSDYISGLCALSNGDLLSCSHDGTILLRSSAYAFVSTKQIGEFGDRSILNMCVLNDALIAISDSLVPLRIYSLTENKTIAELFNLSTYFSALSPLSESHFVSSSFGALKVWDSKELKVSKQFFAGRDDHSPLLVLKNGEIASCNSSSHIDVWDWKSGQLKKVFPSFGNRVACMVQLKSGALLCIYKDNMVNIWTV